MKMLFLLEKNALLCTLLLLSTKLGLLATTHIFSAFAQMLWICFATGFATMSLQII